MVGKEELEFPNAVNMIDFGFSAKLSEHSIISTTICKDVEVVRGVKNMKYEMKWEIFDETNKQNVILHDFGIVTFLLFPHLGTRGLKDWTQSVLPASCREREEWENLFSKGKHNKDSHLKLIHSWIDSSKLLKREYKLLKRAEEKKLCGVCNLKLCCNGDDLVATLVNLKTGRLACSSMNRNGCFHVVHLNCLAKWILICEYVLECGARTTDEDPTGEGCGRLTSLICPQCRGSGLEGPESGIKPANLKAKMAKASKAWDKSPKLSRRDQYLLGVAFPVSARHGEMEVRQKVLHVYHADIK